ncbi:MAG TPA: hypothetical protein GX746_10920, partial [Bacteroidales bacterium]|nr:hypothetical protein [Bacteroidales bacterium]
MTLNLEQMTMLRQLHGDLDNLIEDLQLNHANLETALGKIYLFLNERLKIEVFYVETDDENLNHRVFCHGSDYNDIKSDIPQLLNIKQSVTFKTSELFWVVQPIQM